MPTRREQLTALNAFVTLAASGGSRNRWITGDAFVVSQRGSTTAATGSATQASGGKQGKQQGKQQGKKQGKQQGKQQAKKGKQQGRETPEAKAARLAKKAALKAAKKAAAAAAAKDNAAAGAGGGEPAKPKAKPAKWEEPAETDAAFQKLSAFLTERGAAFTVSSHEAVRTSEEAAAVRGVSLASGAKAMLLMPKGGSMSMLVISAAQALDMKKAATVIGTTRKKIRMASPEQVYEATGCLTGAVPPFGSPFNIPTFIDDSVIEQGETINFNAGMRTKSIQMSVADYLAAENPTKASFRS